MRVHYQKSDTSVKVSPKIDSLPYSFKMAEFDSDNQSLNQTILTNSYLFSGLKGYIHHSNQV